MSSQIWKALPKQPGHFLGGSFQNRKGAAKTRRAANARFCTTNIVQARLHIKST